MQEKVSRPYRVLVALFCLTVDFPDLVLVKTHLVHLGKLVYESDIPIRQFVSLGSPFKVYVPEMCNLDEFSKQSFCPYPGFELDALGFSHLLASIATIPDNSFRSRPTLIT